MTIRHDLLVNAGKSVGHLVCDPPLIFRVVRIGTIGVPRACLLLIRRKILETCCHLGGKARFGDGWAIMACERQ